REMVGGPARPLEHIALIVGAVFDLVFRGNRRNFRSGEFRSTILAEVAKRQLGEAVAGLTHVVIDLEAALELAAIELSERARERPRVARRLHVGMLLGRGRPRSDDDGNGAKPES